jgi:hypothetical protein
VSAVLTSKWRAPCYTVHACIKFVTHEVVAFAACVVKAGPSLTRRIVVLDQAYFCVENLPRKEHWDTIEMDVDTAKGELFCKVNKAHRVQIFQNLPRNRRLYPCMMAINKGQLVFEILDVAIT